MDLGLKDRVVLVTGGASNIGRAISHQFAEEGAIVALADRDGPQAARTVAEMVAKGGRAFPFIADVTDVEATSRMVEAVERGLGPIGVLVNNVGWTGRAQFFLDVPVERWQRTFELNLGATFSATHAVLPRMVERRGGVVVSITSDAAWGEPRQSDYGAMKAGILALTRGLAKEYGRYGIRFNAVAPGLVIPEPEAIGEGSLWKQETGFGEREIRAIEAGIPLRRRSTAEDVAWSVAFLASDRARQLTGQVVSVSGGFAMPR